MTTARITDRPVTSTAVALLLPGQPMPSPWCTDPSMPACDLCDRPTDQLWPLATAPAEDELLAGELLICRSCADAVRPPTHHHHHHGTRRPNHVRSGSRAHPHVLKTPPLGGAMTTTDTGIAAATTLTTTGEDRVSDAAQHLFDADYVMHIAKQSGVAAWIDAAHAHLIAADLEYRAALAAATTAAGPPSPAP